MISLPIIDSQPDLTTVLDDVDEARIVFEHVWVSCYAHNRSVHGKINVVLDEHDRDKLNLVSSGDVELTRVDQAYSVSCKSLDIPPTSVVYPVQQYSDPGHRVSAFDVSPDSSQFAVGHLDGSVYIYPSSPPIPKKYIPDFVTPRGQRAKPHLSAVSSLRFFPSSRVLLSAGLDFSLSILPAEPPTGEASVPPPRINPVRTLRSHTRAITGTGIVPPGKTILSSSLDSTVKVWDVPSGEATSTLSAQSPIQSMAVEGNNVLCGLSSGQFELFDMRAGTCVFRSTTTTHGALSAIAISPARNWFATGSARGVVSVYDFRSLSVPLATFSRNEAGIEDVSFTASGSGLGVATSDGLPFVAGLSGEGNVNVNVAAELAGVNCDAVRSVRVRDGEVWCASDDAIVRKWKVAL
ncbi:WD40-repeat-containing domain protein [Amanita rubescens]|nr:WD40-repeat-containing domain protein [Amanita rubescens]